MVTLTHLVGLFAPGFSERWTYLQLCQPLLYSELSDEPGIMRPRVSLSPGCQWRVLLVLCSPSLGSAPAAGACGLWQCSVSGCISHLSSHAADPGLASSCSHQLQVPVLLPWPLAVGVWSLLGNFNSLIRYVMSECCPPAISFFMDRETSLAGNSDCFEKGQSCLPRSLWGCFKFLIAI